MSGLVGTARSWVARVARAARARTAGVLGRWLPGGRRLCPTCGAEAARRESLFCVECGGQLPEPRRSRLADRRVRWAMLLALALVAGIAAVRVPMSLASDPRDPVEELVAALEAGEVEEVLELVEFDAREASDFGRVWTKVPYVLFNSEALSEGWEPPELTLGESNEMSRELGEEWWEADGRRLATTRVDYGHDWERRVLSYRTDSGWIREWALDTDSAQLAIFGELALPHDPIGPLTVAGVPFEEPAEVSLSPSEPADALIGTYTATHEHPLFEPVAETVVVRPNTSTELTYPVGPIRDEVAEAATEQVHDHIEACAEEATELRPVGCVLNHDPGHFLPLRGDAEWEIESMPEVALEPTDTVHESGMPTITVTTESPGSASVTYAVLDEDERTVSVDVEVGGNVEMNDEEEPEWHP